MNKITQVNEIIYLRVIHAFFVFLIQKLLRKTNLFLNFTPLGESIVKK